MKCENSHDSVPAIGLTCVLQRRPGSNMPLPISLPATVTSRTSPLPSKGRASSGESKFLTSIAVAYRRWRRIV